jgi:hypothetical protein
VALRRGVRHVAIQDPRRQAGAHRCRPAALSIMPRPSDSATTERLVSRSFQDPCYFFSYSTPVLHWVLASRRPDQDLAVVRWQSHDLEFRDVKEASAACQCVQDPEQSLGRGNVGDGAAVDQGASVEGFDGIPWRELVTTIDNDVVIAAHGPSFLGPKRSPGSKCAGERLPSDVLEMMFDPRSNPMPRGWREHLAKAW